MNPSNHSVTPKGTYLPLSHYANGYDHSIGKDENLHGKRDHWPLQSMIITGDLLPPCDNQYENLLAGYESKENNAFKVHKKPRKHLQHSNISSSYRNIEQLVFNEIRQCDICACHILWTPAMEHHHFPLSYPESISHSKTVAESLPHFLEVHMPSQPPLPCHFCCQTHRSEYRNLRRPFQYCGTLFCSKECQNLADSATSHVDIKKPIDVVNVSFPSIPSPKLFFCRNRVFIDIGQTEEELELVHEITLSIADLAKRLRSYHGNQCTISAPMQTFGQEECALMLTTIIFSSWPKWISDILMFYCREKLEHTTNLSVSIDPEEDEMVEEFWALSNSFHSLLQRCRQLRARADGETKKSHDHIYSNVGDLSEEKRIAFPAYEEYLQLYLCIKRYCLVLVTGPTHPLISYSTITLTSSKELTEDERKIALDVLQYPLITTPIWHTEDLQDRKEETLVKCDEHNTKNIGMKRLHDSILRWRNTTHFAHWISATPSTQNEVQELQNLHSWIQKPCFAFSPFAFNRLKHSCVPTLMLTLNHKEKSSVKRTTCGNLLWLALNDILPGEECISKILAVNNPIGMRKKDLQRLMGSSFICKCIRCEYERIPRSLSKIDYMDTLEKDSSMCQVLFQNESSNFCPDRWKRLADLAMQQERFEDASVLYQAILDADPYNGDILHSRAASFLGMASMVDFDKVGHCLGYFLQAQHFWNEAASLTDCVNVAIQVKKQRAYGTLHEFESKNADGSTCVFSSSNIDFSSYLDGKIFLTNDNTPILLGSECLHVINTANHHAARSGWTTSRHYSVPTTDIPIHEIDDLSSWFHKLWIDRIRPLLRRQFLSVTRPKCSVDSSQPRDIFIHDAFVVRYDTEGGQRYLPPHYDESTHSFIISLNTNYCGGGTFVHSLGRVMKPKISGGMLSFRGGEILHSGDPVVEGVRYIIAAFCYVDLIHLPRQSDKGTQHRIMKGLSSKSGNIVDCVRETIHARETEADRGETFSFDFTLK